MLISEQTKGTLYKLSQKFFQMNRTWDNFLGFSNVEWAFSTFSSIFHPKYAHLLPILADQVNDILLRYNEIPVYLVTNEDLRTYTSMRDFFEVNLREHQEALEMLYEAIDSADENNDKNVAKDLDKLLRQFNRIMEMNILLLDKAKIYGEANKWAFDAHCEDFYTIQDVYDNLTGNNGGDDD